MHICNPSSWEAELGGLWVQGPPGKHRRSRIDTHAPSLCPPLSPSTSPVSLRGKAACSAAPAASLCVTPNSVLSLLLQSGKETPLPAHSPGLVANTDFKFYASGAAVNKHSPSFATWSLESYLCLCYPAASLLTHFLLICCKSSDFVRSHVNIFLLKDRISAGISMKHLSGFTLWIFFFTFSAVFGWLLRREGLFFFCHLGL